MAAITISRQFGAGGRSLGERLCERFGFHLVDEFAIDEIARKAKVSGDWLTAMEKEASSTLLGLLSGIVSHGLLYRNPAAPDKEFERKKYIDFLRRLMVRMANEGGYVLLGRGAQFVLHKHPKAFHILLVAEHEDRVNFMVKRYALSEDEAEKIIKEKEGQRAAVATNIFGAEIDDPKLYHLVLNMSLMPFDWAVETAGDFFVRFRKNLGEI
ncbi:MAG: cytidylate kinase-like family protein [Desulfobacterota bacterium]|jgi:cytidylate kinase|nr:cytidylate kinase-like family protein [Thermodesulfobacteriota bacterium]